MHVVRAHSSSQTRWAFGLADGGEGVMQHELSPIDGWQLTPGEQTDSIKKYYLEHPRSLLPCAHSEGAEQSGPCNPHARAVIHTKSGLTPD